MKRIRFLGIFVATALAALAAPAIALGYSVYVGNFSDDDVSVIDTATNTLAGPDIAVGDGPFGIAITPNGSRAYVANGLSSNVSVIDTASRTLAGPNIAVGSSAYAIAITPNGTRAYVTNVNGGSVSVIDTATNTLAAPDIAVGNNPAAIAITPNGARAYVTNDVDSDVSVIDTATNAVVGPTIPVGTLPEAIAITPDGSRAYVANATGGDISVIDTTTNTVVGPAITVGNGPVAIAITPNGARAYVANANDNDVSVIDIATNTLAGPDIPVGNTPQGVAITPDGSRAYVTNFADDDVSVIDTASNALAGPDIAVGDTPQGIAIATTATSPPPGGGPTGLPAPVLFETVNVVAVKGKVFVSLPPGSARAAQVKGRRFIPLEAARQIPVGSLLDTRKGTVRIVSARDTKGATQSGDFLAGVFQVLQSRRGKGLTELRLKGASFGSCAAKRGKSKRASVSRRRLSKRTVRRLGANADGRFRTRGKHSAATVRGTKWVTTDRCDGTLTKVQRGRVAVRDFRRKRTVVLRAGKSYLARAPR